MKVAASGDLHGRAVEEWFGKTPDSKPPKAVLDRLFLRQQGRCKLCGRKIMPGDKTNADHIVPLKDGGQNRETNLQLVIDTEHVKKTAEENSDRAKERRLRLKHNGLWPKPKKPLLSRGFTKRNKFKEEEE